MATAASALVREDVSPSISLRPWLLLAGLASAAIVDSINSTVLSIARAQMMGSSHATPDEIAWVSMAYFIAKLTMFPVAGWLARRVGLRRALLGATSLLIVSSLACAMTTDHPQMRDAALTCRRPILYRFVPHNHRPRRSFYRGKVAQLNGDGGATVKASEKCTLSSSL